MRKLGSKRKEEKKQKRKQLIVGIVLASILFVSIFGYSFGRGGNSENEENRVVYNGYEFVEENSFWFTEIGNLEFSFKYNPNEIELIHSNLNSLESYSGKPLYISSDNVESSSEIYRNLMYPNSIVQRMQSACLEGEECGNDELAVKTCEDNFIIIKEANTTEVIQEGGCVFIKGKAEDLTRITDGFLLKIIGVQ